MASNHYYFPPEGELNQGDIYPLLYHIYKNAVSGLLVVEAEEYEKQLVIEERKIVFALSNREEDAFGKYLLRHDIIDEQTYRETSRYMETHGKRFGRALMELGHLNYDQIWTWILDHLKMIVYSVLDIQSGRYRLLPEHERDVENIVLDMDIIALIVKGMRGFKSREFLETYFKSIDHLYVGSAEIPPQMDLKPYELHVFDLVRRNARLADIIKNSELLEFDTLRLLYLFLVVEAISTEPKKQREETGPSSLEEEVVGTASFTSFAAALKHYNMKYELIYKTLSKEIGPVALSILLKAIQDILENLPSYFQKIQLTPDGRIDEDTVLKLVWYQDFNRAIGDFLRGLEEILYTEIYAVKKHLGVDYEQQVLKWINRIGN